MTQAPRYRKHAPTLAVLAYATIVLGADALAASGKTWPFAWGIFRWHMDNGADLSKLIAWFIIPFAFCAPWMDWQYLGVKRWRRGDVYILAGLVAAGMVAVLAIPLFPGLRTAFHGIKDASASVKWQFVSHHAIWTLSWLTGWEFLHRYVLLRHLGRSWPRFGWLLIPVFEGAYHLTWNSWAMPAGMVLFSLVVTFWARSRRNTLLPFLAHLAIELELIGFRIIT